MLHLFVTLLHLFVLHSFPSSFPLTVIMAPLFKLNGHLVLTEIRSISPSYVSLSCIRRLGLLSSREVVEGAVSVNIGNSWATFVVSLLSSSSECSNLDIVLAGTGMVI